MITNNLLQAKMNELQRRIAESKRKRAQQAKRNGETPSVPTITTRSAFGDPITSTADMMHDLLTPLFSAFKSAGDDITQDAAALDELRKSLNVSDAMHRRLSTLINDPAQLRDVYTVAAKQAGITPPMFSDNLDKPMMDALSAGLPRAVAEAVSANHRLNGDDILSKIGDSFFFGAPLKLKK